MSSFLIGSAVTSGAMTTGGAAKGSMPTGALKKRAKSFSGPSGSIAAEGAGADAASPPQQSSFLSSMNKVLGSPDAAPMKQGPLTMDSASKALGSSDSSEQPAPSERSAEYEQEKYERLARLARWRDSITYEPIYVRSNRSSLL